MTDPSIYAAAAVTVIAASVTGVVTIINALAAAKDREAARVSRAEIVSTGHKADTIIGKTTEIHAVTNGNLTKTQAALDVAMAQIDGYKTLIASLVHANDAHTAAAAAAAAATSAAAVVVAKATERRVRATDADAATTEGGRG